MRRNMLGIKRFLLFLTLLFAFDVFAQNSSDWAAKLQTLPVFSPPSNLCEWTSRRSEILQTVQTLLGSPPKPDMPDVAWSAMQDSGDYTLERFVFDNADGASVPGYFLLPKNRKDKIPAILYCHCHGGQYAVGKDELFQTRFVPEPPGPALVRKGWAVLAVDACCFGERRGKGPGRRGRGGRQGGAFNGQV